MQPEGYGGDRYDRLGCNEIGSLGLLVGRWMDVGCESGVHYHAVATWLRVCEGKGVTELSRYGRQTVNCSSREEQESERYVFFPQGIRQVF